MKIDIQTDKHIQADDSIIRHTQEVISARLAHFASQLSRVNVHLSDTNAGRGGAADKHCLMEARIDGRPPAAASHDSDTVALAISGAAEKLHRVLESSLGRAS